jgi:hypothetical protein
LSKERLDRIKPLFDKLGGGRSITAQDVFPFAKNLVTREAAFQLLSDYNKMDLFPEEYLSLVKGAESNLANWLEFPTELDGCPDEMEHIKRVTFDFDWKNNNVHYEVFKYRVNEPHWAAKDGWILGVVGPFLMTVNLTTVQWRLLAELIAHWTKYPLMKKQNGFMKTLR